jgi:hypothetical protein
MPRFVNNVGVYTFNVTRLLNHSLAGDGVSFPAVNGYVEGRACPPNTYNNACAHKHKYDVQSSSPPVSSSTTIMPTQPTCTPCPNGGWHTAGLSGAWFCLPPPGKTMLVPDLSMPTTSPLRDLMNLHRDSVTNMSLLWSRRDILGKEFECGNVKEHCYQCAAEGLAATATPDDFNQEVILKNILQWVDCPSRFYCPTALDEPIPCPAFMPWSPSGSASVANCTCARGTYLSAQRTCVTCPDRSACPVGQYMSGWTQCTQQDGATSPGVCIGCTNLPTANAVYVGAGKEAAYFQGDGKTAYAGVCPFTCTAGARLTGSKICDSNYKCTPIGAPLIGSANNVPVFSAGLTKLRDGFVILPQCGVQLNLTIATSVRSTWPAVATSCTSVNSACATEACIVTHNASYDSNYECAPCPPAPLDG